MDDNSSGEAKNMLLRCKTLENYFAGIKVSLLLADDCKNMCLDIGLNIASG